MLIDCSYLFDFIRTTYSNWSFNEKDGSVKTPIRYFIDITYRCNLRCPYCYLGQKEKQLQNELSAEEWLDVIKQIPRFANISIIGGEPFVKKGFLDVYHAASKRTPGRVNIYSNGILLTEELVEDFIKNKLLLYSFSIDAWGENHDRSRCCSGAFDTLVEKTEMMMSIMKKRHHKFLTDVKTLLLPDNHEDLLKLYEWCSKVGIDFFSITLLRNNQLRQYPILREEFTEEFYKTKYPLELYFDINSFEAVYKELLKIAKHSSTKIRWAPRFKPNEEGIKQMRYFYEHGQDDVKELYEPCVIPFSGLFINPEGDVYPCLAYKVGSVRETSLKEIINGTKYKCFRKNLKASKVFSACQLCCDAFPKKKKEV